MLVLGESVEQSIVNCLLQRREESNLILEDLILMRVFNSCRLTLALFQCTIAFGSICYFRKYFLFISVCAGKKDFETCNSQHNADDVKFSIGEG